MKRVVAIVYCQVVCLAVECERAFGYPVGVTPCYTPEVGAVGKVSSKGVITKHNVAGLPVAVGSPDLRDGRTVVRDPDNNTILVLKGKQVDVHPVNFSEFFFHNR
jgi:hypothetical protein